MSRIRQYARNAGALVGQSIVQRIAGIITAVVLSRMLGTSGFGTYSAVANTASSTYGIVRLGVDGSIFMHSAGTHKDEATRQAKGRMLGAGLILLLISAVIGAAGCIVLDDWLAVTVFGHPKLSRWLPVAGVLVFMQCLSQFCYAMLVGLHRFSNYARVMIVSALLGIPIISTGCIAWGLTGALAAMVLVQTCTLLWLLHTARSARRAERISLSFDSIKVWATRHIKFGFPLYAAGLVSIPVTYYLQGVLSRNVGLGALGEMRIITSTLSVISFVPSAISAAMISMMVRSSSDSHQSFIRDFLLNLKFVWLFAVLAGLAAFILMPIIVILLFGKAYRGAISPASIAILATIFSCVLGVIGNALFSKKRVNLILMQTLIQMFIFAAFANLLIPRSGLNGYFIAQLMGSLGATIFLWTVASAWRERYIVNPPWLMPLVLLTVINGLLVILYSALQSDVGRYFGGSLQLFFTTLFTYRVILDSQEKNALTAFIRSRFTWPEMRV